MFVCWGLSSIEISHELHWNTSLRVDQKQYGQFLLGYGGGIEVFDDQFLKMRLNDFMCVQCTDVGCRYSTRGFGVAEAPFDVHLLVLQKGWLSRGHKFYSGEK